MDFGSKPYANPIKRESWRTVLTLAYQSLGVVYGDLSISPLYVYKSTFAIDIKHSKNNTEIYGVLSCVFWTLTLIPLLKYVFIVLRADDNGEGGTFALYSLLCRRARLGFLPNGQLADEELSAYKKKDCEGDAAAAAAPCSGGTAADRMRRLLENHHVLQRLLMILALLGASMVIGDGVLTPALSVFTAVSGFEFCASVEHHQYLVVPFTCLILFFLFALQHYGTQRVGFLFAPIVMTWLLCISIIGVYNIFHWNPHVYEALSPYYLYNFLKMTRSRGWMSLGGILLCITGSEALYTDLGHFSQSSIKIAFTFVVYPSLLLAYMGQAAYLSRHHMTDYQIEFYISVPEQIRWPVVAIAVLAAVVASQAVITGTFSIIKQCSAMGYFPWVKIVHTSSEVNGQIYIPEINWMLMTLCLAVTIGFRDVKHMSNASGLAVITVMLVTSCLMSLVIVLCWHKSIFLALCFILFFGTIEGLYFSASLIKFLEGAWFPITFSFILTIIMYIWHYGTLKKYECDAQNKVSINWLLRLGPDLGIVRVRGIGVMHTELISGIPAIFSHFVTNVLAFHQVLVFVCIKSVPVPYVQPEERFLVGRVGPKEQRLYRVIARYGYRDMHKVDLEFERDLVSGIAEFIQTGGSEPNALVDEAEKMAVVGEGFNLCEHDDEPEELPGAIPSGSKERQTPVKLPKKKVVRFLLPESPKRSTGSSEELQELMDASEGGTTFILGHPHMRARWESGLIKRLAINVVYDFLRRNCRGPAYGVNFPHASTVEVGMIYHV